MLNKELRQTIFCLKDNGKSNREISRILGISRNTVKKVLCDGNVIPAKIDKTSEKEELLSIIKKLFFDTKGNVVRIQEMLNEHYKKEISYSTLTRIVREEGFRGSPKRAGEYIMSPGAEMQHDTSPHKIKIGESMVTAQCASLVLAYSRRIFIQYYPRFTRFEAKIFLRDAFEFMGGSCKQCVIDNTSVILAGGSGSDAVFSPEMLVFCRMFDFEFIAHKVGHADRKARVERPFRYVETNFIPGRIFHDWQDLNTQAINWCVNVSNKKIKRSLGMSPDAAYIQEKPYMQNLPEVMPPIYECYHRKVDIQGFVHIDSNRYSVPDTTIGKMVDVYKYAKEIQIYYNYKIIATHERLIGKKYGTKKHKEHHTQIIKSQTINAALNIEKKLYGEDDTLNSYVKNLKKNIRGRGFKQLSKLLCLKRTYPADAFIAGIHQAEKYKLYDLSRLEGLIIKYAGQQYFNLTEE